MRVAHSLSLGGVSIALLAAFGVAGQSRVPQQKQSQSTQELPVGRPDEQMVLQPVHASWSDLVKVSASLPRLMLAVPEIGQAQLNDPPTIDISAGGMPVDGAHGF